MRHAECPEQYDSHDRRHRNQECQAASMSWPKIIQRTDHQNRQGGELLRMRHAQILKCRQTADCRRDQIIGHQEKRPHNRDHLRAMTHTRINTPAVRVMPADDDIINAHQRGEHAHRRDEPEGAVARDSKSQSDNVGFTRSPISIKDGRRSWRIHIPGPIRRDRKHNSPKNNFCFRESWSSTPVGALEDCPSKRLRG